MDTGTGVHPAPAVTFAPSALNFGSGCGGSTDLVLTNEGTGPTGPITLELTGADASSFGVVASSCDDGLAPSASCTVTLRFAPLDPRRHLAELVVVFAGTEQTVLLAGTGVHDCGGYLTMTPTPVSFGPFPVGEVSPATTFTVRNAGGGTTAALVVALEGMDPSQFELSDDRCSGVMLVGGAYCTFDVRFAPMAPGTFRAAVRAAAVAYPEASAALNGIGE